MEKYIINGGVKLSGSITLESSKNAVLPMIAGSLLTDEKVIIKRCPKIKDVLVMVKILNHLGVKTNFDCDNLIIDSSSLTGYSVPEELCKELRASVFMLGALLGKVKKARLYYPGGCDIGARPIDIHLDGIKRLGVNVTELFGEIICTVNKTFGRDIYLKFPSVGATENLMMVASTTQGKTEIHNCAKEPEVVDFMRFLNSMGAKIYGAGTSTILVEGVKKLHGTEYLPSTDRIECGTYLLAGAITGGEVEIKGCNSKNICSLIHKLCENTCKIIINNDIIYLKSGKVRKGFNFCTGPHPYFPTDLQAQTMALACVSEGQSSITETVFENRFAHVKELLKMGADICVKGKTAIVKGRSQLSGATVVANDLRGGASLVLAGLNADGKTTVKNVRHVDRGYFDFDKKLLQLGANIKRC